MSYGMVGQFRRPNRIFISTLDNRGAMDSTDEDMIKSVSVALAISPLWYVRSRGYIMRPMSVLAISLDGLEPPGLGDIFGFFGDHPIVVILAAVYLAYRWVRSIYDFYHNVVTAGRIAKHGAAAVGLRIGTWREGKGISSLVTRLTASALIIPVPLVWIVICAFIGNVYSAILQSFYEAFTETPHIGPDTISDPLALSTGAWIIIVISLVAIVVATGIMGWTDELPYYWAFVVSSWSAVVLGLPAAIILAVGLVGEGWHPMALPFISYIAGFWLVPWVLWWASWLCKLTTTPEKYNIVKRLIEAIDSLMWRIF